MAGSKRPLNTNVLSISLTGLDAHLLQVVAEPTSSPGGLDLVGLTEAQARESRVRVCAGLWQIGIDLRHHGLVVRVEPADPPKKGGCLDAAIAMAVLEGIGQIPPRTLHDTVLLGEVSLTGALRPIRGVLPALHGAAAHGVNRAIVPAANAQEAALVPGIRVFTAEHLNDLVRNVREGVPLTSVGGPPPFPEVSPPGFPDLGDIRGQHTARRALEITAAGGHHLLLIGQPGSGKTMLARRLSGVLPPLSRDEALEVTALHSIAGLLPAEVGLLGTRPFRAPHHTVSAAGLGGGGDPVRPGEVSLAHNGVLFLDEVLEFRRNVLETLRGPLEEGHITLVRNRVRTSFPARPILVAASNPCPCGFAGDGSRRCTCTPERKRAYQARLSGPLIDRCDVRTVLPPVDVTELQRNPKGEPSSEVQKRVIAARAFQHERVRQGAKAQTNAQLSSRELEQFATPDAAGARILAQAKEKLILSPAVCERLLRVARTIADLDGSESIRAPHIAEAVQAALHPAPTIADI